MDDSLTTWRQFMDKNCAKKVTKMHSSITFQLSYTSSLAVWNYRLSLCHLNCLTTKWVYWVWGHFLYSIGWQSLCITAIFTRVICKPISFVLPNSLGINTPLNYYHNFFLQHQIHELCSPFADSNYISLRWFSLVYH